MKKLILKFELWNLIEGIETILGIVASSKELLKSKKKSNKNQPHSNLSVTRTLLFIWLMCLVASIFLGSSIWNLRNYAHVDPYILFLFALSIPAAVLFPMFISPPSDLNKLFINEQSKQNNK